MAKKAKTAVESPFDPDYYQKEIGRFNPVPYEKNGIVVKMVPEMFGRVDGAYYKSFESIENFPTFRIDGKLWMSITPMEAETHYIPIKLASEKKIKTVVVGGLGLGYYVARIMGMSHIKKIVVYEYQQKVVDYFTECYGDREGFSKIEFVVGDIREKFVNQKCDFCYMDIYEGVADTKAVEDRMNFLATNKIKNYWFWTEERMHFWLIFQRGFDKQFTNNHKTVLDHFKQFALSDKGERFDGCIRYDNEELEMYEEGTVQWLMD